MFFSYHNQLKQLNFPVFISAEFICLLFTQSEYKKVIHLTFYNLYLVYEAASTVKNQWIFLRM
ncbi:hypothetical protein NIES3585_36630 [Nodularia sp. NIES-3585]|nr:hypothetical protein NIES3585_36630 [Nodularia sp. NIES-3585]